MTITLKLDFHWRHSSQLIPGRHKKYHILVDNKIVQKSIWSGGTLGIKYQFWFFFFKYRVWKQKDTHQLRVLAALSEDPSSISRTPCCFCNNSSRASHTLFWSLGSAYTWCTNIQANTHTNTSKIHKNVDLQKSNWRFQFFGEVIVFLVTV